NLEVPFGGIENWHAAFVQHGPFQCERLPGRQPAFDTRLLLKFPAAAISKKSHHNLRSDWMPGLGCSFIVEVAARRIPLDYPSFAYTRILLFASQAGLK